MTVATVMAGTATADAATLKFACGTGPQMDHCKKTAQAWAEQHGHTVEMISTPNSATEQLALYQQMLAAKSADIDIYLIDVVWPGILAQHMVDLKPHSKGAESEHFQTIVENNTVDDKLIAMPWYTDAALLYYRQDLLEKHGESVPETWEQLTATAEKI